MVSITAKSSRVRRSESAIRALLKEHAQTNITVNEFCKMHAIHTATFYNWRNKYSPTTEQPGVFIPLRINNPVAGVSVFAEIELGGNIIIRLYQPVDCSWFKALL
jgi:hypothetical protein